MYQPNRFTSAKTVTVTVMRGGAIGDFVLTLPAIGALREHYSQTVLHIIGRPSIAHLAQPDSIENQDAAHLTPLYSWRKPLPPSTMEVFQGVDILIAYSPAPDDILADNLRRAVNGRVVIHDPRPLPDNKIHIVDHLLSPIKTLGIPVRNRLPHIPLERNTRNIAERFWEKHHLGSPTVVIHPGSGSPQKCWPLKRYISLAERLGGMAIRTIFILGETEREYIPNPIAYLPQSSVILDSPRLTHLAAVLSKADLFVGNDSGPGHIAAAVDTPTLILFGPTDPRIWGSRHPFAKALRAPDGRLELIEPEFVMRTALESLEKYKNIKRDFIEFRTGT